MVVSLSMSKIEQIFKNSTGCSSMVIKIKQSTHVYISPSLRPCPLPTLVSLQQVSYTFIRVDMGVNFIISFPVVLEFLCGEPRLSLEGLLLGLRRYIVILNGTRLLLQSQSTYYVTPSKGMELRWRNCNGAWHLILSCCRSVKTSCPLIVFKTTSPLISQ